MKIIETTGEFMKKEWNRFRMDSVDDARKLRSLINEQYRSRFIDLENTVLVVPGDISKEVVIGLAAQLGLVCVE
jgi:hypothetical protein